MVRLIEAENRMVISRVWGKGEVGDDGQGIQSDMTFESPNFFSEVFVILFHLINDKNPQSYFSIGYHCFSCSTTTM